jgi:hypothetical protein
MPKPKSPPKLFFAAVLSVLFLATSALLLYINPCPSAAMFFVLRVLISLAAALLGSFLIGTFRYKAGAIEATGGFAIFAFIYLTNPAPLIVANSCAESFDLTIILKQKDHTSFNHRGIIKLIIDKLNTADSINYKGMVTFSNIAPDFQGKKATIEIEAQGWMFLSGEKTLDTTISSEPLLLMTRRDSSLCCVSGTIVDESGKPLPSAKIIIKDSIKYSDSNGRFRFVFPEPEQKKSHLITIILKPYAPYDGEVWPASSQEPRITLKRK